MSTFYSENICMLFIKLSSLMIVLFFIFSLQIHKPTEYMNENHSIQSKIWSTSKESLWESAMSIYVKEIYILRCCAFFFVFLFFLKFRTCALRKTKRNIKQTMCSSGLLESNFKKKKTYILKKETRQYTIYHVPVYLCSSFFILRNWKIPRDFSVKLIYANGRRSPYLLRYVYTSICTTLCKPFLFIMYSYFYHTYTDNCMSGERTD